MASSVNFGTQQYFGFDPRTIPGCALWLDAADSNTVALSGSNITQWNDKSGNTNTAVAGTSTYPIYTQNGLNGAPIVGLRGANDYFLVANNFTTTAFPSLTYFIVINPAASQQSGSYAAILSTDTAGAYGRSLGFGSGSWQQEYYSNFTNITPYTSNVWSFVSLGFVGTSSAAFHLNGVAFTATASGTGTNTTGLKIGSYNSDGGYGTFNANFDCAEILVYGASLTTTERQQVEGYLAWKWALTANLPSTHPFKTAPPTMRLFQPVDVEGGALLWLDAADTRTITGSPITLWTDKSGRGSNATTGTGSVVAGDPINGLNTLRFGSSIRLYLSNFVMPSAQTSVFYVFKGITSNASGGTGYFIFSRTADNFSVFSGNEQFFSYQNPGAGRSYVGVMGPGGERNWGNLSTTAFFNAVNVISTTGVSYASSNGLSLPLVGTCNVSNTVFTASTYQISTSRSCCGDVYTYDLGELVVCDGTVSTTEAQRVEGYLAWKWGVQSSLPTTHPYYRVLPSTPLFTPNQLSGLVLWMDPADSTTLTLSGSSVTQWRDKSASAATFSTVNASPTYTASLINGLPGIDLTNASGFISSTTQTLTSSLTLAMVLVVKSGIGTWGSFFTHGSRDNDLALERNSISTGTTLQFQTANDNAGANITFTTDQVALYLGTMTTGTSRFFSRFGGGTTTTATGTNTSTIAVGLQTIRIGRSDVAENCNSFIGEIVYYNRVLTTPERQELEGYLAWKWGLLASLPSTHPFAEFRP